MTANINLPPPVLVTSLEHSIWLGLHSNLETTLKRLSLTRFSEPTMLILHDLIDCAVKAMHRSLFMKLVEDEFGIGGEITNLESLYSAEVTEHGSQNIAQYCSKNGWHVEIIFPVEEDDIVKIISPVKWDIAKCKTANLMDALDYELNETACTESSDISIVTLQKRADKQLSVQLGSLLEDTASLNSIQNINGKLGYGVILFSSSGELIAASRAMLANVQMPVNDESITSLCAAIPFNFYNDIIWGLALTGNDGVFENYRVRMHIPGEEKLSILFNVSGYRDDQSVIHSRRK